MPIFGIFIFFTSSLGASKLSYEDKKDKLLKNKAFPFLKITESFYPDVPFRNLK